MKAIILERYKHPARMADALTPNVGPQDVLIEVYVAGVNPVDHMIRNGELKSFIKFRFPFVLGNDVAGIIAAVGTNVTRFKVGDAVYAKADKNRIGTFAEFVALDQNDVALKPEAFSMVEAGAFPLVGLTAWQALVDRMHLKAGQKILIHAGGGGVGTIAIQLAKHLGATVATTVSTSNVQLVKDLGADVVIDRKSQDFADELRDYDFVLDTIGGETLFKSYQILKPGGLVVGIAGPPDRAFAQQLGGNAFLKTVMTLLSYKARRQARKTGVRYSFLFMKANGKQLTELTSLIDNKEIRVLVDRTFAFESFQEAFTYVDEGRAKAGKVVLQMKEETR